MMENNKTVLHFPAQYLKHPLHPVTVTLIGAGGTGCQMLSALARIHASLVALGHMGLSVTVYDPDTVEEANLGRQLFCESELGLNKAVALVTRFNRFYGTDWKAVPRCVERTELQKTNIIVTAVDNIKTRLEVDDFFRLPSSAFGVENECYYWLDLGNAQRTGQIVLGSTPACKQPTTLTKYTVVDKMPDAKELLDLENVDEKDSGPSCSLAEALEKQDLFINSTLANIAGSILWSLFRDEAIETAGCYVNLDTLRVTPIPVQPIAKKKRTRKCTQ